LPADQQREHVCEYRISDSTRHVMNVTSGNHTVLHNRNSTGAINNSINDLLNNNNDTEVFNNATITSYTEAPNEQENNNSTVFKNLYFSDEVTKVRHLYFRCDKISQYCCGMECCNH
jgi:hypothetical protein